MPMAAPQAFNNTGMFRVKAEEDLAAMVQNNIVKGPLNRGKNVLTIAPQRMMTKLNGEFAMRAACEFKRSNHDGIVVEVEVEVEVVC